MGGWKLTDQLERRTQRILNDQEGLDLSWLTEGPTSLPELMDSVHGGTERIDYTEQSSPNSPGWKGRMWTDGTKEELSLLSAGYI